MVAHNWRENSYSSNYIFYRYIVYVYTFLYTIYTFVNAVILQFLELIGVNGKPIKFNIAVATATTTQSIAIIQSSAVATTTATTTIKGQ